MVNSKYATLQIYIKSLHLILFIVPLSLYVTSCGLFDKELKQDKHMAEFRYRMNKVMDSLDNHKERIKAFEMIIEGISNDEDLITPRKKNILLIEGNTYISNEYLSLENYKKATEFANRIIEIDSTSPKGYYNRGCIYQIQEQDSLAILDYSKALKLNSDYPEAYYNRGIIYEGLAEYDNALDDYSRAIKLNPSYIIDVYNNRGNTYLAKEAYDKAIADYSKVIGIDTVNVKAYSNRAGAYIMQKEFDKALTDCDKAITLDSVNINAYNKRASIYEQTKQYEEAMDDYKKILELDPYDKSDTHEVVRKAMKKLRPLVRKK